MRPPQGFDNFIDVERTISTITINDTGMVIPDQGMAGRYGLVYAARNVLSSHDANSKGSFTNLVQAIDDTGTLESSLTLGLWSRTGTRLKVYGVDHDLPTRILPTSTVDLRAKSFQAKVWELD